MANARQLRLRDDQHDGCHCCHEGKDCKLRRDCRRPSEQRDVVAGTERETKGRDCGRCRGPSALADQRPQEAARNRRRREEKGAEYGARWEALMRAALGPLASDADAMAVLRAVIHPEFFDSLRAAAPSTAAASALATAVVVPWFTARSRDSA